MKRKRNFATQEIYDLSNKKLRSLSKAAGFKRINEDVYACEYLPLAMLKERAKTCADQLQTVLVKDLEPILLDYLFPVQVRNLGSSYEDCFYYNGIVNILEAAKEIATMCKQITLHKKHLQCLWRILQLGHRFLLALMTTIADIDARVEQAVKKHTSFVKPRLEALQEVLLVPYLPEYIGQYLPQFDFTYWMECNLLKSMLPLGYAEVVEKAAVTNTKLRDWIERSSHFYAGKNLMWILSLSGYRRCNHSACYFLDDCYCDNPLLRS